MADNKTAEEPDGTDFLVATDEIAGVNYQVIKLGVGADGSVALLSSGAGAVSAGTPRMTLASDDPAVANLEALLAEAQSTTPVNMYPLPATPVRGLTTAMTGTTSTAVTGIGAGGTGVFNYITQVTISNTDVDTGTLVNLQDGSGGTTFYTFPAPAAINGVGAAGGTFTFPTPLKQPTANTALYAVNATTGASVTLAATGFQA